MKTIRVEKPVYDAPSGNTIVEIADGTGGNSTLSINFKKLLPFVNPVNKEVIDFFVLSAAVYGIDRFVQRKKNSLDGWSREFKVNLPVHNYSKWASCKEELNNLLSFLTGDYWKIEFRKENFEFPQKDLDAEFSTQFSQVNLLSGGLDSLIGALDFLNTNPNSKALFVSHYDSQMGGPKTDQSLLINELKKIYPNQFAYIPSLKVSLSRSNMSRETTFRSRSLLFTGIALLAAQRTNTKKIIIPENGTVSLNFPLSSSRRSSCSTRTTHPFVLDEINNIWSKLSIDITINNPYEFQTKGEMVASCNDATNLYSLVTMSNSCGKRGHRAHWQKPEASHCGICMPCVYRKASLWENGDFTTYGSSINSLFPFYSKKAQDVGACLDYLKNPITKEEIKKELIVNGVKNSSKINQYVDLVWRTRSELREWIKEEGDSIVRTKAGV